MLAGKTHQRHQFLWAHSQFLLRVSGLYVALDELVIDLVERSMAWVVWCNHSDYLFAIGCFEHGTGVYGLYTTSGVLLFDWALGLWGWTSRYVVVAAFLCGRWDDRHDPLVLNVVCEKLGRGCTRLAWLSRKCFCVLFLDGFRPLRLDVSKNLPDFRIR